MQRLIILALISFLLLSPTIATAAGEAKTITGTGTATGNETAPITISFPPAGGPAAGNMNWSGATEGGAYCPATSKLTMEGTFAGGDGGAVTGNVHGQSVLTCASGNVTVEWSGTWTGKFYANGAGNGTMSLVVTGGGGAAELSWQVTFSPEAFKAALGTEDTSQDVAGETGQIDEGDFGQDPNLIKEGETDNDLTVDRILGDATVSREQTTGHPHLITTGSNGKTKIHYGESEIVIGPNSKLRVRTTTNKFGQPVIMWEFLNPDAVIYVKDSTHGTRQEESGVLSGSGQERMYTNLWRGMMIFYNGSYQGKKDLGEFNGGATNQPEFFDPGTGEHTVIVGIKGTEYYYQATGSARTLFLKDGEIDLHTGTDPTLVALAAGDKVTVDETGAISSSSRYTSAEIDALAKEVDLAEQPADNGSSSSTTLTLIAIGGAAALAALAGGGYLFARGRGKSKNAAVLVPDSPVHTSDSPVQDMAAKTAEAPEGSEK